MKVPPDRFGKRNSAGDEWKNARTFYPMPADRPSQHLVHTSLHSFIPCAQYIPARGAHAVFSANHGAPTTRPTKLEAARGFNARAK